MNENTEKFDAIIIGVGQAGNPLAHLLADKKWKVAVIERHYVGGSCINYGCTPTKTMVASAKAAYMASKGNEYGFETGDIQVKFNKVVERKNNVVKSFRNGIEKKFEDSEHIELIYGEGSFVDSKVIKVSSDVRQNRFLTAEKIFVNTGASPRIPGIKGIKDTGYLNSTTIMELEEVPEHLLVIGGSYIGLEFGQMFARFGSKITIFESHSQLIKIEDEDVAEEMKKIMESEGATVILNAEIDEAIKDGSSITLKGKNNKDHFSVTGSHLLVAAGRTPNTKELNLDQAGINYNDHGFIRVNDQLETNIPGVYALGDVKGGPAFTHISYDDFRIVQKSIFENEKRSYKDRPVPYTMFTDPQLGRMGFNEKEAKKKNISYKLAKIPVASVARAIETGDTRGLMKVLIDDNSDQIIGAAILCAEGGEIMSLLQVAMMGELKYTAIRDGVFAHPTYAESLNNLFVKVE